MSGDADIIGEIDRAFGACPKPEHFGNYAGDPENTEHDQLLRARTRETLTIGDVGNIGFNPISFCDGPGIAYYFPALARFAISSPTHEDDWYGDLLLIHLTSGGSGNRFLRFCNVQQRRAVGRLLKHLQEKLTRVPEIREIALSSIDEFVQARALWSEP